MVLAFQYMFLPFLDLSNLQSSEKRFVNGTGRQQHCNATASFYSRYITYDPNYDYGSDDEENDDEDLEYDDDDDEEDDYSDDDDMSWKVMLFVTSS